MNCEHIFFTDDAFTEPEFFGYRQNCGVLDDSRRDNCLKRAEQKKAFELYTRALRLLIEQNFKRDSPRSPRLLDSLAEFTVFMTVENLHFPITTSWYLGGPRVEALHWED